MLPLEVYEKRWNQIVDFPARLKSNFCLSVRKFLAFFLVLYQSSFSSDKLSLNMKTGDR